MKPYITFQGKHYEMSALCEKATLCSVEIQTDDAILDPRSKATVYEKIENTTRCRLIQMVSLSRARPARVTQRRRKIAQSFIRSDWAIRGSACEHPSNIIHSFSKKAKV